MRRSFYFEMFLHFRVAWKLLEIVAVCKSVEKIFFMTNCKSNMFEDWNFLFTIISKNKYDFFLLLIY